MLRKSIRAGTLNVRYSVYDFMGILTCFQNVRVIIVAKMMQRRHYRPGDQNRPPPRRQLAALGVVPTTLTTSGPSSVPHRQGIGWDVNSPPAGTAGLPGLLHLCRIQPAATPHAAAPARRGYSGSQESA